MKKIFLTILALSFMVSQTEAKVDLVTLPNRDTVQVTIYNSADLTLVREKRALTLKEGFNKLQFSWANTLIDPMSLDLIPQTNAADVDIYDLSYPPRVQNVGVWKINSSLSTNVPVEINYLTSGLSWRAFYIGTLSKDEKEMYLKGYVRVQNNSGEDYENAQVRLIVGKVHLIDQIATLAQRQYPYGGPYGLRGGGKDSRQRNEVRRELKEGMMKFAADDIGAQFSAGNISASLSIREVVKEGLSEYFLYTIEGQETIPTGWAKRLPSFDTDKIPVINLYKYEEQRYGHNVTRFLSFNNDEEHELGETPIPGGIIKVFRNVNEAKHLSYEGQSSFKYIPVDEEAELNLGAVTNIKVEPKLMSFKTTKYQFDQQRNISGWDEVREFKVEVKNTRNLPIKVEIKRNFNTTSWGVKNQGDYGDYEKVDKDTIKYTLELAAKSNKEFTYTLTTHHGTRSHK